MTTRRTAMTLGLVLAAVTILLDQVSKWYILDKLEVARNAPIELTGFFNLVMVWNYGVSFGMLSHPESNTPYFLIAVAFIIVSALAVWLWQCLDRPIAIGIGFVIGGALGNVIDRFRFGAVADFFDVHVAGYHWPAFNIADSGIFIGVAILLWDGLIRAKPKT